MDRGSLESYSPWGCKESDTTERVPRLSQYDDPKYLGQWVLFFRHLSGEAEVQTWEKNLV